MNKPLLIGYHTDTNSFYRKDAQFDLPAKSGGGVDFILCHNDPSGLTVDGECEKVKGALRAIKDLGAEAIINFEHQNFVYVSVSADGYDWANRPDGTHLLRLPEKFKEALASEGNLVGIMYDELEHVIINRNVSIALASKFIHDIPAFPLSDSKDVIAQGELLDKQLKAYADELKTNGIKTLSGEHVFPVLFHNFAKNGIIPNFKSQKESFSNIQFAVAAGAALQYKTPLFNCIDMWFRMTFPGHSADELYSNLCFAYYMGVDRVYVESSKVFFEEKENGKFNDIGKAFNRFTSEYRGKERDYNIQDYKPEIGIIRFEDTFWGQGVFPWRNMLFGNPKIKPDSKSKEWIKAFNIITHGETGNGGICLDRVAPSSLVPHRSFASMNGAAVFDENVDKETLSSLKLCFLCGQTISGKTMEAVRELVKEGLTVVTPTRFAPIKYSIDKKADYAEVKDGNGTWIVTDKLTSSKLKERLKPFLDNKGEMTYKFADKTLRFRITDKGDTFREIK
ncbi:MAG: hypothetical protein MJ168_04190 [Clostridia bacterium]|nr:hypothetical protein [Clostridia bacterium]